MLPPLIDGFSASFHPLLAQAVLMGKLSRNLQHVDEDVPVRERLEEQRRILDSSLASWGEPETTIGAPAPGFLRR